MDNVLSRPAAMLLGCLVNHIALPPHLPGKQEDNIIEIEQDLLVRMQGAARVLHQESNEGLTGIWDGVRRVLELCKSTNIRRRLEKTRVSAEFQKLQHDAPLLLHVTEQNAGLIIWRQLNDGKDIVTFECFEASAASEKVLAAENALLWDFPGEAIAIPYSEFANPSFQDNLAIFLEQASTESVKRFTARAAKAGSSPIELRDTVNPALITQMLMTLLEANGDRVFPTILRKRIRDDVCWASGSEKPWRRSAFWLVLRVGIERYLCSMCDFKSKNGIWNGEAGRVHYKFLLCTMISCFIRDSLHCISPDSLVLLQRKLARRISKLQIDCSKSSSEIQVLYDKLFASCTAHFQTSIKSASDHLEQIWSDIKLHSKRPIPLIPARAKSDSTVLSLKNSGDYLEAVLARNQKQKDQPKNHRRTHTSSKLGENHFSKFSVKYYQLSRLETFQLGSCSSKPEDPISLGVYCTNVAKDIEWYLSTAANSYDNNPELKSQMILHIMKLWINLDQSTVALFALLKDFHPGINPEDLDVLQLSSKSDMEDLHNIQTYLRTRCCTSTQKTIFDPPKGGCFAERYYDDSSDSEKLQALHTKIERQASAAIRKKEEEWRLKSAEFEQLERTIATMNCAFVTDNSGALFHDNQACRKCYLQRRSRRIIISAHEFPLPSDPSEAKAVIFELAIPDSFKSYRNATWRLLFGLSPKNQPLPREPKLLLERYSEIQRYGIQTTLGVCLASTTKSFLLTHYRGMRFPVPLDSVCLPNGLTLSYFDTLSGLWTGPQFPTSNFAHHFQMKLPSNSPYSSIGLSVGANAPSSYEIIAGQTRCPSRLNPHEFMAYKTLFSGNSRRWLSILVELGSANLNLSAEATTSAICQLAIQAGPADEKDYFRTAHKLFRDTSFCRKLMDQVSQRLESIASNWREINCMEMLLTIILRLCSLAPEFLEKEVLKVLKRCRTIILNWLSQLRIEIRHSPDAESAERISNYSFSAALLCRRTFSIYAEKSTKVEMDAEELESFIEASITMQDNSPSDLTKLSSLLKSMLVRDIKTVYKLRDVIRSRLIESPQALYLAIDTLWPQSGDTKSRFYSEITQVAPAPDWVCLEITPPSKARKREICYHMLEGHLFVDGQPLGKLPAKHQQSVVLEHLFGKQRLLIYQSDMPGMTYQLAFLMDDHEIHMGFLGNDLIVQARVNNTVLEYIPSTVFGNPANFDLPGSLVANCVHWLDLKTGVMEVRRRPNIWRSKKGYWRLNVITREAWRNRAAGKWGSSLVDPHSPLFKKIGQIFDHFEQRSGLTVFQPAKGNLTVELRRLELSFFAKRGLLYCRELQAEIDPNQDAGTWYGLDSKLVFRNAFNPSQRTVLVPMGPVFPSRKKFHVTSRASNEGSYGRFTINDVLGRLDCPAEPLLMYQKAQFHALTSFVLSDPLTGRTGTEEAIHCLRSASCQPWSTLNLGPIKTLESISRLVPKRSYYPSGLRMMQHVDWDDGLNTTIQHDGFQPAIEEILKKARLLSSFSLKEEVEIPCLDSLTDPFLLKRAYWRRLLYQRPDAGFPRLETPLDSEYKARDRFLGTQSRLNVFEISGLIKCWSPYMCVPINLAATLEKWPNIEGFNPTFEKFLLSDLLELEFASNLGTLINLCRSIAPEEKHRLMFMFGIISFRADVDMRLLRNILAFAVIDDLKDMKTPQWPSYLEFKFRQLPTVEYLTQLIKPFCVPYKGDERSFLHVSHKTRRKLETNQLEHETQVEKDCATLSKHLLAQWPCREPKVHSNISLKFVDISGALETIIPEWLRLFQNIALSEYITEVQTILNLHYSTLTFIPASNSPDRKLMVPKSRIAVIPALSSNLLCQNSDVFNSSFLMALSSHKFEPVISKEAQQMQYTTRALALDNSPANAPLREIEELTWIVKRFEHSDSMVQRHYCSDMMQSIQALRELHYSRILKSLEGPATGQQLDLGVARQETISRFENIKKGLRSLDVRSKWLVEGGLWPCITPVTLLEQLRSASRVVFGKNVKGVLTDYAISLVTFQRCLRVADARMKNNIERLSEEMKNPPHLNWEPINHTDWILLEIDANICIRPDQVDVARATISPASNANSVLQMNMGQGKTSCIMPMVASELADTTRLVRLIIPKALLAQTAQLLQSRLGGLIGREVKHLPFSRKTPTKSEMIQAYFELHKETRSSSGIILSLPEHILSFKLSGLQRLSDSRVPEAKSMIKIQTWLQKTCRDILDESDFTLATKTQLIYPSGTQAAVDGHPYRWETAEELFRLLDSHLWNLQKDFPQSIEVIERKGSFPVVYFLRTDAEEQLILRLVKDIVRGQTAILPTRDLKPQDRAAIKSFISNAVVQPGVTETINKVFSSNLAFKYNAYLLRGLFVHRILLLTLKKRWNVQYGLHPDRDPIAVPFTAKGVPSEQAEWGHPDVAILFTCLAFYYGGLTLAQLRQSIEHLVKSDDPSSQYDRWIYSSDLPDILREWNVIETDDEIQLSEIWSHLRYQTVVIDYYLNHFVFPKHAKQFQVKLQASGWDIPLFSTENQNLALTSGFSGTNDNRTLLPLNIRQQDLPMLAHTNAEVLTYLLQHRNRKYERAADFRTGKRLTERGLLQLLSSKGIRMLIDSGAQILEMDNFSLAKEWLDVDFQAPAVLYFDSENKPYILYRNGSRTPLLASPYAENLADCRVYLDEAHTRGTDLKMPRDAVGALTLGLGQTKDHTVQAAMRLRQLATTQSIVFLAPPEVHQSILDLQGKSIADKIDSNDVICWLLKQTCLGIEQIQPLYYSQGLDFCSRVQAGLDNPNFISREDQQRAYCKVLRQTEKQTLEQLYRPISKARFTVSESSFAPEIAKFVRELKRRKKEFQDFGGAVNGSALQEVEQEREVAFEVETVREVQKPIHYSALSFPGLHQDVLDFATHGRLFGFAGYQQAFVALKDTALGQKHGISTQAALSKLYVSKEFMKTVKLPLGQRNDNLLRPINWLIWSSETESAMIVIPEEAELLLSLYQDQKTSGTHLLTYAAPVTRKMLHFNNLDYFAIPPLPVAWSAPKWLTVQLGILSGRVYFEFDEYDELRNFIGITGAADDFDECLDTPSSPKSPRAPNTNTDSNIPKPPSFTAKPLLFLQDWLSLKRRGQEFTHTPMGYVCQGKALHKDHPFFSKLERSDGSSSRAGRTTSRSFTRTQGSSEDDGFDSEMEYEDHGGYFEADEEDEELPDID